MLVELPSVLELVVEFEVELEPVLEFVVLVVEFEPVLELEVELEVELEPVLEFVVELVVLVFVVFASLKPWIVTLKAIAAAVETGLKYMYPIFG